MWRGAKRGSALPAVLAAALVHPLAAQNTDAPRAPRIIDAPSSAAPAPPAAPAASVAAANRAASRARQPAAAERGAARAASRAAGRQARGDHRHRPRLAAPGLGKRMARAAAGSRERGPFQRDGIAALRSRASRRCIANVQEPRAAAPRLHRAVSLAVRPTLARRRRDEPTSLRLERRQLVAQQLFAGRHDEAPGEIAVLAPHRPRGAVDLQVRVIVLDAVANLEIDRHALLLTMRCSVIDDDAVRVRRVSP